VRPLFAELAGREEWAVRVVVEPAPAQHSSGAASGRAYLAAKKQLIRGDGASRLAVKKASSALAALSRHAARVRKDAFPPPAAGRPFVAGASMLVPVKSRKRWKQATSTVASSLASEGNRLEVSGPWPPYRFVSGR
jgi:hypothetical protein